MSTPSGDASAGLGAGSIAPAPVRATERSSKPPGGRSAKRTETIAGWAFVAPSLIHFLVFIVGLLVASLVISTWRWDLLNPPHYIGLANYRALLHDQLFRTSVWHALYFTVLTVPTGIVLGLAFALAVNTKLRGISVFRAAYFLPFVVPIVAVAIIWRWVYNPDFGLLNWLIGLVGIGPVDWLGDPTWAMPSIALMSVWKGLGWSMTLFLAGLQAIPRSLYEAAEVDGASRWQQFRNITWPLLTPTTFFVSVTTMIGSFQVFDAIYLMTQGGPGRTTTVQGYYLYQQGFRFFNMGYAAAMAWIVFAIIAVFTFIQFRFLNKRVNYELG